jgi:hypothetical protein
MINSEADYDATAPTDQIRNLNVRPFTPISTKNMHALSDTWVSAALERVHDIGSLASDREMKLTAFALSLNNHHDPYYF